MYICTYLLEKFGIKKIKGEGTNAIPSLVWAAKRTFNEHYSLIKVFQYLIILTFILVE